MVHHFAVFFRNPTVGSLGGSSGGNEQRIVLGQHQQCWSAKRGKSGFFFLHRLSGKLVSCLTFLHPFLNQFSQDLIISLHYVRSDLQSGLRTGLRIDWRSDPRSLAAGVPHEKNICFLVLLKFSNKSSMEFHARSP